MTPITPRKRSGCYNRNNRHTEECGRVTLHLHQMHTSIDFEQDTHSRSNDEVIRNVFRRCDWCKARATLPQLVHAIMFHIVTTETSRVWYLNRVHRSHGDSDYPTKTFRLLQQKQSAHRRMRSGHPALTPDARKYRFRTRYPRVCDKRYTENRANQCDKHRIVRVCVIQTESCDTEICIYTRMILPQVHLRKPCYDFSFL